MGQMYLYMLKRKDPFEKFSFFGFSSLQVWNTVIHAFLDKSCTHARVQKIRGKVSEKAKLLIFLLFYFCLSKNGNYHTPYNIFIHA